MSSADSVANQTEFDMEAIRQAEAVLRIVEYRMPIQALAIMAVKGGYDSLARCVAVAVVLGETEFTLRRQERRQEQVGPRFQIDFDFDVARVRRLLGDEATYDFDRSVDTDKLVKVIDGNPSDWGIALPWPGMTPAAKPWWRFW